MRVTELFRSARSFSLFAFAVSWAMSDANAVQFLPSSSITSAQVDFSPFAPVIEIATPTLLKSESIAEVGSLTTAGARASGYSEDLSFRANAQFATSAGAALGPGRADGLAMIGGAVEVLFISGQPDERLFVEFFLPPTLLEVTNNLEAAPAFGPVRAGVSALFSVDSQPVFRFDAELVGQFARALDGSPIIEHSFAVLEAATLDGQLDVAPLLAPTVIVQSGFETTITAEFPEFGGLLDLGLFTASDLLLVSYTIEAFVAGAGTGGTSALAAINDPLAFVGPSFAFSSIIEGDPGPDAALPAPATLAIALLGFAVCAVRGRVRSQGQVSKSSV